MVADPGYMLIAYGHTTIELPLWLSIIISVITFGILYTLIRLWKNARALPKRIKKWLSQKRYRVSQHLTNQGLFALSEGDVRTAEKKLIKSTKHNFLAWLNYLAAAEAAHIQDAFSRRDNYLSKAIVVAPEANVAAGILQAQFQLEQNDTENALANLKRLYIIAPKQKYILRQLAFLQAQYSEWQELVELLPKLRRYNALSNNEIDMLEENIYQGLLSKTAEQFDLNMLQRHWLNLPRRLRNNVNVLHCYITLLRQKNADHHAEVLLRKVLPKLWDAKLIRDYGLLSAVKSEQQLTMAEKWLRDHAQDPELLLALGRICLRNQLWGKARSYFETSVSILPKPETYQELAKLAEKLNDNSISILSYYKTALELAQNSAKQN